MANRKTTNSSPLQQKVKVLTKLYESGCTTEKGLQSLTMESILQVPGITIADMQIILELQKQTKANKLFSYLGGDDNDQEGNGQAHHME